MKDYKDLKVWEKGHELVLAVYKATASFPKEERYSLTSQLRRACTSIPANIAEGCGRSGDAEFARFIQIATGSASETEYHLLLSRDLGFLKEKEYQALSSEVLKLKKMLIALLKKLRSTQ